MKKSLSCLAAIALCSFALASASFAQMMRGGGPPQFAGVFNPKVGDRVERGQRVGLIKFGSRVDVVFDSAASLNVKVGDRVQGGASVLAYMQPKAELAVAGSSTAVERSR